VSLCDTRESLVDDPRLLGAAGHAGDQQGRIDVPAEQVGAQLDVVEVDLRQRAMHETPVVETAFDALAATSSSMLIRRCSSLREAVRDPVFVSVLALTVAFSDMDRQIREVGDRFVGETGERGDGVAGQHHRDPGCQRRTAQVIEQRTQAELATGLTFAEEPAQLAAPAGVATSYAATTGYVSLRRRRFARSGPCR